MAWKLVGHPKTVQITKVLAEKFQMMEPAIQDRPISEVRCRVYEKIMRVGGFRPISWAAAYCKETGETYRVNGKHTSLLCTELPLKEIPPLFAIEEYYECDTLQDVAELYSTYDSKMQARTVRDINAAFASTIPELEKIDLGTITTCVSAIAYGLGAADKNVFSKIQPQERAEALFDHHDFVCWVFKLLGVGNRHLKKMPVVAAMYVTWQRAPRIATEFWETVRDETGPTPDHPTRKLVKYLLMNSRRKTSGERLHRIPDKEYYVKCIRAWNSFRTGEPTNLQYHPEKPVPDVSK